MCSGVRTNGDLNPDSATHLPGDLGRGAPFSESQFPHGKIGIIITTIRPVVRIK